MTRETQRKLILAGAIAAARARLCSASCLLRMRNRTNAADSATAIQDDRQRRANALEQTVNDSSKRLKLTINSPAHI
jgi:hypothetical protein